MPKTKMDKARLSKQDIRSRIIRAAAARAGLYRDKDLASLLGLNPSGMCNRLAGRSPWFVDEIGVLTDALNLSEAELYQFIRGRNA